MAPFGTGVFPRVGENPLVGHEGQWALIRPGQAERGDWIEDKPEEGNKPKAKRAKSTNNARIERLDDRERLSTATKAWREGYRCLIPSTWYQLIAENNGCRARAVDLVTGKPVAAGAGQASK